MKENTKKSSRAIFWLELTLVMLIPLSLCHSMIPTNVLNSHVVFEILNGISSIGMLLVFVAGIPLGIMGIKKSKEMEKLRIPTFVLSIINLSAGTILIVGVIVLICAVVFGGVSH